MIPFRNDDDDANTPLLGIHFSAGEFSKDDTCQKCHTTCDTCSDGLPTSCLTCSTPLLLQGSRCVTDCSGGFYNDHSGCSPCLHTCEECVSRQNCSKCRTPLLLQSGECRTTCANGLVSWVVRTVGGRGEGVLESPRLQKRQSMFLIPAHKYVGDCTEALRR